jgi:ABC-type branched-subunit amino acid transport system permease subunit
MFYGGGGYIAAILILRDDAEASEPVAGRARRDARDDGARAGVGALTVRLYGIYFALLTLAFAQMVYFIVEQAKDGPTVTTGCRRCPTRSCRSAPRTIDLTTHLPSLALGRSETSATCSCGTSSPGSCCSLVIVLFRMLTRSQFGEVLDAIRENEQRSV